MQQGINLQLTLREKCPNTDFFWSVFSDIWTEYEFLRMWTENGDLRGKSPYSVRILENTDQKKTPYLDTFHSVSDFHTFVIIT